MKTTYLPFLFATFLFAFASAQSHDMSDYDNSTLCGDFFKTLINPSFKGPNISVEINNFYSYSGHNLNDLGSYKTCQKIPTQKYSLLGAEGIIIGFCGPAFCSVNQLQNYTNTIIEIFSNLTRQDLSKLNVGFVDPDEIGIEQGFSFYFTLLIYFALIALVIAGTISASFKRTRNSLKVTAQTQSVQDVSLREALMINKESSNDTVIVHDASKFTPRQATSQNSPGSRTPLYIKAIECFDIGSNLKAFFKTEEVQGHDQNLNVFNGIRTMAFGWVVYGHTFMLGTSSKNILSVTLFMKSTWALIVITAFFAVDTFFYLSGFFTGFLMISKLKRMKLGFKNYGMILFHRWIRLWPAYFIAIMFYWKISVYFGDGPLWYSYVASAQYCDTTAWKNFLFLDNVLNANFTNYCFSWGWYLSCDFQMFLIAPLICWLYIKDRKRSEYVIWILMAISIMASYNYLADAGSTYILMPNSNFGDDYMLKYYVNPVVRMSPY